MEEKKLTDEEIAKAILQQVEYNAGIPYIDEWGKVRTIKFMEILDFIHRLQGEKQVIECHGMLKGCDMVQQAVKNTAKEIFETIFYDCWAIKDENGHKIFDEGKMKDFAEKCYGVEVE